MQDIHSKLFRILQKREMADLRLQQQTRIGDVRGHELGVGRA